MFYWEVAGLAAVVGLTLIFFWRAYQSSSVKVLMKRILTLTQELKGKEREGRGFSDIFLFGLFGTRFVFGPVGSGRNLSAETGESKGEKEEEISAQPDPEEQLLALRSKYLIPRLPKSTFEMPRYLRGVLLGQRKVFELVAVRAKQSGIWHFAKLERELRPSPSGKKKLVRRPLRPWEYVTSSDVVGRVVESHFLKSEKYPHYPPQGGHIITFEVLDGAEVKKEDIILILAVEVTDFLLPKK